MFKSKRRQIVTPQSEHLKLVGTLAMLWGNDQFDAPPDPTKQRLTKVIFQNADLMAYR